jgi:hypothetical protein
MANVTPPAPTPTQPYKAVLAFVLSVVALVWADLQGKEEWGTLGFQDWVSIIVPAVLVAAGVWVIPNPAKRR